MAIYDFKFWMWRQPNNRLPYERQSTILAQQQLLLLRANFPSQPECPVMGCAFDQGTSENHAR
jgi:hypothetical protein